MFHQHRFSAAMRRVGMVVLAAVALAASSAHAMENLKILVPANPGGGWDQTGRALQAAMQSANLAKATIDNKGGAGGTIGIAQFVNSQTGDPNALMVGGMVMVGAIITNKSPVTLAQVTPIARLTGEYEVIVVPASSKIQTLKELMAQLKANPGSVSWGGGSAGGTDHILAAMVAQAVGADPAKLNYIAYAGGGEALAAILGGHVVAGVSGYGEFAGQIKSGKMRALAISSDKRVPGIDIPTLKEQGVDVVLANWRGVFGAARHHRRAAQGPDRPRHQDGEDARVAGHAQEERVGGPVRERRRVQGLHGHRADAHRQGHRKRRPRQEVSVGVVR